MRIQFYLILLPVICFNAYSQNIETITKSKTVILPQDYASGIPEYYIPEGTSICLSVLNGDGFFPFINKTSFLSRTNETQITNLSQWTASAYSAFKADVSVNPLTWLNNYNLSGPVYLKMLPRSYGDPLKSCGFTISVQSQVQASAGTNTPTVNPNTAVVIPSTVNGDVEVVLEQSQDGVTWTQCLPGTYNASTVKRFFRLRAVEK
jgi:hypothetical protein